MFGRRLSFRLMLTIGLLTALIFGVFSSITWRLHSRHLHDEVIRQAALLSETIRIGMRDQMLANRFAEVDKIIQQFGTQTGIERIRVFDKLGMVLLSTDPSEPGAIVSLTNEQCVGCHVEGTPKVVLANPERTYKFANGVTPSVMGMITPIRNEPDCSGAPCHAHPPEKAILGVLDVNLSLESTEASLEEEARKFTMVSVLGCLLIVAATGVSLWRLVYRPIHDLTVGTQQLSAGNLDHRMPTQETDEFHSLAESFDRMTSDLRSARDEVHEWNRRLEERVQEKSRELEAAHDRMIQSEKMASLGKLAAVVAHEINNPLAGILTYIKLLRKTIRKRGAEIDTEAADGYLAMSEAETVRVGNIVKNLLAFTRPSSPDQRDTSVNAIIEKSLQLLAHQMDLQNVEQIADLAPEVPTVRADPAQMQQALLAILINAVEAMPEGGRMRLASRYDPAAREVRFCVSDTGVGIPKEEIAHLFEPFYTTKTEGKGVGLGLFVVYGIVRRHGGTISVESDVSEGTTFTIVLPVDGAPPDASEPVGGPEAPVVDSAGDSDLTPECREALRRAESGSGANYDGAV